METAYSLSDIAALNGGDGFGGANAWVLIILFALIFGNGGFGYGNNKSAESAIADNEILAGQRFDGLSRQINAVGDGISSLGYSQLQQMDANAASINGNITSEGRALQSQLANCCCENQRNTDALRYDMAQQFASTNANTTAQTQKILDAICQNKIETLQSQLSNVQNQLALQQAISGVPKINPYMYGIVPQYSGCGCNSI